MKLRFGRLPLDFDAAALQRDLAALAAHDWPAHFNTGYHDGGWSGLSLVSDDGSEARLYGRPADVAGPGTPTPALAQSPALAAVLAALPAPVQSARLLRLAPGSVIREHRDPDLGLEAGLVRLHVPIASPPEVAFHVDNVRVPMAAGECWYLDLSLPHRVHNASAQERVHLVVDCRVTDALRALLPPAATAETEVAARQAALPETGMQRFLRFREAAFADPALLDGLAAITQPDAFVPAVVQAGAERGWHFGPEDVRAALLAGRRAWIERHTLML